MSLDESIYGGEDYFAWPKESFRFLAEQIRKLDGNRLLDIGCAQGEFLHYLRESIPGRWCRLVGIDISERMIAAAEARLPGPTFGFRAAAYSGLELGEVFDLATACGLLGYVDDLTELFATFRRHVRPGGHILLFGFLNPTDIDAYTRFRYRGHTETANLHAIASVRECAGRFGFGEVALEEFRLSFPLAAHPDNPRRAWTMETEQGRLFFNGLGQYFRLYSYVARLAA